MGATDISIIPARDVILPDTVFVAGSATTVPLTTQGAASQTANLMEYRDSAGNLLYSVSANGRPSGYYRHFLFGGN